MFKTKNQKACKETGKYGPSKEKKSKVIVPEKDFMADVLKKDSKRTILKMFKHLKEDVTKVKKIMYEQNGNTNKERGNPNRKSK